jgi:DNA-directed RNA polymerase specialized sigma subunit
MTDPVPPKKRKRRKKKKNYYFTEVHEKAILDYCASTDMKVRTELYVEYIQPAFDQMVDKIAYTYKFTSLPNIDVLKDDCKIWLTTILDKFDPSKGSKAFSYFSVITKNWFIHKVKKNKFHNEREVQYEEAFKGIEDTRMIAHHQYIRNRETREFWENFFVEVETWDKDLLKENEQKVLKAVKILFESSDNIEIFNKKAIYLYLRELTDLNTKQVVNNLNKLRIKYRVFKKKWDAGKI